MPRCFQVHVHSSTYTVQDQERMARAKNYVAWQSRLILPELGQRVVEVGCGAGNFTGALLDREAVIALDPEPECIEHLSARYQDQVNLRVLVCDPCSAAFADIARFHPDSCVCINVLEHIEDDQRGLAAMAAILEPRGKIVLWVPAFQALYGPMDRRLDHYRRYRRERSGAPGRSDRPPSEEDPLREHCRLFPMVGQFSYSSATICDRDSDRDL